MAKLGDVRMFHLTSEKGRIFDFLGSRFLFRKIFARGITCTVLVLSPRAGRTKHTIMKKRKQPRKKTEKAIVLYRNYGTVYTVFGKVRLFMEWLGVTFASNALTE